MSAAHAPGIDKAAALLRAAEPPVELRDLIGESAGAEVVALPATGLHLGDDFWEARPILDHVRTAARSRLVAPDAVLASVLARAAAICPHTVELPPLVGSPVGLTFFAVKVGPPETGKSAAAAVGAELLPAPDHVHDRLPIGSGEGMVEVLFEVVEEEGDDGKPRKVKRQTRHGAIFHVDEGQVLGDLGARAGSTLLATIRGAFSHAPLGNTNASAERRRILDGRAYVYGITLGLQPELAAPLLADTAAGTPQRFAWLMATDPAVSEHPPAWPGDLPWQPPDAGDLEPLAVTRGGWRRHPLAVADAIRADVVADRVAAMRGGAGRDPADAHRTLLRLKVAALLAILDGRLDVADDDWHLASLVVDTSRRVRHAVAATVAHVERRRELAASERHTRRELHVDESKEARALTSAARSVGRVVARHGTEDTHDGDGCSNRCCARAIAGKHRALVSVEDVLAEAEAAGWIVGRGGSWHPGESRPA